MSNISMVEAKLPPGFRFHPRDEELVCDYLMKKVTDQSDYSSLLIEVDLNKNEPWDIPESACVGGKEWYFYNQRDRKYATGVRTNRATVSGYWKATGKDRAVHKKGRLVGMRKTLVFYQGRAPKGKKSDWVMHEFRLEPPLDKQLVSSHKEDDWVLCRVFYKKRVEVATTPSVVSCYDNNGESKSLPALMDSSYINFDHHFHQYEQVPCFSNFPQNQTNFPISKQNMTQLMDSNLPNKNINIATMPSLGGGMPNVESNFANDNEVLKAVLNQLTKMERNPTSKGSTSIEGSSGSYLSEVGMPNMWSHY